MAKPFFVISVVLFGVVILAGFFWYPMWMLLVPLLILFGVGLIDLSQTRRAVRRNFPVIGHFRYLLEMIRPEINQYFIESEIDGVPFNRMRRSVAYQRAKGAIQTVPFGTPLDVYEPGYEFINHSLNAKHPPKEEPRIRIGGPDCDRPYDASILNISAMSYGSLSHAAIRSLNTGAARGGFFHNTGEGGISPHHTEPGGDLCWQIGTGYFGCRDDVGAFDPEKFRERVAHDTIKLVEIKLSQGAKPGHGGILPAKKITPEISAIRGVPMGQDVLSPPTHTAFRDPRGLLAFVAELRELSGGKPIGIKLCLGHPAEFFAICLAMRETGRGPDFITVDGGEGGTGAAPLEFTNSMGAPLTDGLVFVHNALVGFGLRDRVKVIASGKILTGFDIAKRLAIGADLCSAARGFMFSLGCIQARRCNTNDCPVGVATTNPSLVRGLVVSDKGERVRKFHDGTVDAFYELLGAAGLDHPDDLTPWHLRHRVDAYEVKSYGELFPFLEPGQLLTGNAPPRIQKYLLMATADSFTPKSIAVESRTS